MSVLAAPLAQARQVTHQPVPPGHLTPRSATQRLVGRPARSAIWFPVALRLEAATARPSEPPVDQRPFPKCEEALGWIGCPRPARDQKWEWWTWREARQCCCWRRSHHSTAMRPETTRAPPHWAGSYLTAGPHCGRLAREQIGTLLEMTSTDARRSRHHWRRHRRSASSRARCPRRPHPAPLEETRAHG